MSVPFSTSNAFVSTVVGGLKKMANEVGFKIDVYENTGQKTQWIQGIQQGINQHYNLIDLFAPDLLSLVPQAMAAKAAGIPIVSSHDGGLEQSDPSLTSVFRPTTRQPVGCWESGRSRVPTAGPTPWVLGPPSCF